MSSGGEEAMEDMLQRHRKEAKELQAKEMEMKKAAAKGSKAEQKAKKKQVEETVAKLEAEMKARQAEELASLKGRESASNADGGASSSSGAASSAEAALQNLRLYAAPAEDGGEGARKASKAQKRKGKKAAAEAEREKRIEEELSGVVSDRMLEDQALAEQLRPLGLAVKEIKPDGHCMFRAIEDQLRHGVGLGDASSASQGEAMLLDYLGLRRLAAEHMREHGDDFAPFIDAEEGGGEDGGDLGSRFEQYCEKLQNTAAWGGQLELQALAQKLRRRIVVYCPGKPNVEVSAQEGVDGGEGSPIRLSYHRHAFGLGEHYNSVVKLETQAAGDEHPVAQEDGSDED